MTNAEKFKQVFRIYATELWAKPEKEFLEWLNAEAQSEPEKTLFTVKVTMSDEEIQEAVEKAIDDIWKQMAELENPKKIADFDMSHLEQQWDGLVKSIRPESEGKRGINH